MFEKKPRTVAGAMSGTSLDGVDGAVLVSDGVEIFEFGPTAYRPYTANERAVLYRSLGTWPEQGGLDAAEQVVFQSHAEIFEQFSSASLFGFHGQTLAHDPARQRTHQLGDGARLAKHLGKPLVWDFRSADVALGGQGAPLAPFFHFACAKWIKAKEPLAFLNLGGVGNLTWIDPTFSDPTQQGALLSFDTGPANAPLNDFMRKRCGSKMDENGEMARRGQVIEGLLEQFLNEPYFNRRPPKSLDRNAFVALPKMVRELSDCDGAASLTAICALSVMCAMDFCPKPPAYLLVSGGGRKNPVMMNMIAAGVDCPVQTVEEVGLNGDMLEAQAFAYLAMRVACGLATSCKNTTGVPMPVGGGILSYPPSD